MEEEILQKIKDDYVRRKEERANLLNLMGEIAKLEENETVKKYLALTEELASVKFKKNLLVSDEELLDLSFRSNCYSIKKTNNIYVCLGTFRLDNICDIVHGPSDIRLNRDDPRAEYRIYRNIEDGFSEQIPIKKCAEFEATHKVIFPKTSRTDKFYYELKYIGSMLKSSVCAFVKPFDTLPVELRQASRDVSELEEIVSKQIAKELD